MNPGFELDHLVAQAIGAELRGGQWWTGNSTIGTSSDYRSHEGLYEDECTDHFRPSCDLDDALLAARIAEPTPEKQQQQCEFQLRQDLETGKWTAWWCFWDDNDDYQHYWKSIDYRLESDWPSADTPAHAICLAIIKLKEHQ